MLASSLIKAIYETTLNQTFALLSGQKHAVRDELSFRTDAVQHLHLYLWLLQSKVSTGSVAVTMTTCHNTYQIVRISLKMT